MVPSGERFATTNYSLLKGPIMAMTYKSLESYLEAARKLCPGHPVIEDLETAIEVAAAYRGGAKKLAHVTARTGIEGSDVRALRARCKVEIDGGGGLACFAAPIRHFTDAQNWKPAKQGLSVSSNEVNVTQKDLDKMMEKMG